MLGIFASPTDADPAITTNAYYISAALPNDPDFGPGVVYFGFALYIPDDDTWYFFEGDRTGESVSSDQVSNIRGQMQSIVPSAGDSKMRRPAGLDQNTIDQYNAQGMALAQRLRDSTGSPNEEAASDSGWARVH
jgi:hypothetical protein